MFTEKIKIKNEGFQALVLYYSLSHEKNKVDLQSKVIPELIVSLLFILRGVYRHQLLLLQY